MATTSGGDAPANLALRGSSASRSISICSRSSCASCRQLRLAHQRRPHELGRPARHRDRACRGCAAPQSACPSRLGSPYNRRRISSAGASLRQSRSYSSRSKRIQSSRSRTKPRATRAIPVRPAPGGRRGEMSQTRRLAAILAADVAGYSRLMGADEEGTLERLKALRRELLDPEIAEYHGRIVKTTGDGMLVEFASVVDAVRCAVAVQQAMPERNTDVAAGSRIELRIGINLGDVIVEGDDLYGDGVNIAARIEALADAGG